MSHARIPKSALIVLFLVVASAAPALAEASLDIRPSACPNLLNVRRPGYLPMALVSDRDFVASRVGVDPGSLELSRGDGMGGFARPLTSRGAISLSDVAAPAVGGMCSTFGADGLRDLKVLFGQSDVAKRLHLRNLPAYSSVELCLSGEIADGSSFNVCDDVLLINFRLFATEPDDDDNIGELPM